MPKIKNPLRRLLDRIQNRFARSRPGSVLVLVVALLVLMALIGTAFITTARTDRFSAQQNAFNTEIDLLVQGVVNMAEAAMTTTAHEQAGGQHWDDTRTNPWLASRIPGSVIDACGPYVPLKLYMAGDYVLDPFDPSKGIVYVCLVDNNANTPTGTGWYKLGDYATMVSIPAWSAVSSPLASNAMIEDLATGNQYLSPRPGNAAIVATPTALAVNGKVYPALSFVDLATGQPVKTPVIAASASGDGIADSFLWRLPIGEINGVTYYAATRIIDNNAAVNLNTALCATLDFDYQGTAQTSLTPYSLSFGIYPSNIGLAEMLKTLNPLLATAPASVPDTGLGTEMNALNFYRYGGATRPDGIAGGPTYPTDDFRTNRTDFQFNTEEEALYMGLGRRTYNPGWVNANARYQSLSWGDAAGLAYRFGQVNPNASPTTTEMKLVQSLYNSMDPPPVNTQKTKGYRTTPWNPATDIPSWYATFQGQLPGAPNSPINVTSDYCLRPFVTTHNPLNNLMPIHTDVTFLPPNYQTLMMGSPYCNAITNTISNTIPRVSLNTADVLANDLAQSKLPSLWLGFFNAMYDGSQIDPNVLGQPLYKQFRSSLRDLKGTNSTATTYFTPVQQLWVRSLIAAVNARDLRDSDDDVTSRTIQFLANVNGPPNDGKASAPPSTLVNVTVFGTERQPYITEVYANNDISKQPDKLPDPITGMPGQKDNPNKGLTNVKGYVAVELHNPYSVDISLNGWQLGILTRSNTPPGQYPAMAMTSITDFSGFGPVKIPANGYAVLENYQVTPANPPTPGTNDATYRPFINYAGYTVPTNAVYIYVPNLQEVFHDAASTKTGGQPGGELYLLRPRRADGNTSPGETDKAGKPYLAGFVPADSFDFTGTFEIPPMGGTVFKNIHYVRANGTFPPGNLSPTSNNLWRFVYPGRWTPNAAGPRLDGIFPSTPWDIGATPPGFDPWINTPPAGGAGPSVVPANDGSAGPGGAPINLGNPDPAPSYTNKFPSIQLNNTNFGGPNKLYGGGGPNRFPYGGFARLGDVLQVPFIGGYTVTDAGTGAIIEMNAVTMDSSFADDLDGGPGSNSGPDDNVEQIGRFCPLNAADPLHLAFNPTKVPGFFDPYAWAAHVMDYFTALSNPHDDYLPNIDPNPNYDSAGNYSVWNPSTLSYQMNTPAKPTPVANLPKLNAGTANNTREDIAPIEGLINVNTAPFAILRRVPFVTNQPVLNDQIAQSIIAYRNVYGPFRTLFDLNNVPGYQILYGGDPSSAPSNYDSGDLSTVGPSGNQSDGVVNDFEKRFMEMTRVSNLLTTRSDTYTAYILVQGWRGIGTANAELVVERRAAFIADRSGITATNKSLNIVNVQTN